MEGTLAVPPDRGTIIGRALWKTRFVVVGPQKREQPSTASAGRIPTPRESPGNPATTYLSIYKSKSDPEPIQQYHIGSITDCQVQMVAHRKQGPVLATLVLTFAPDPAADKLRKRRSSRAAGLTSSSKETPANTLWFRSGGDDGLSLQEWARYIQLHMQQQPMPLTQYAHAQSPMSPVTPASPTFTNPFASSRGRDQSEYYTRPPSGSVPTPNNRGTLQHKASQQTQVGRDRPNTYSGSPSLRSKRSDISSHTSVMNHMQQTAYATHYGGIHTTDLPSPATTIGDYQGDFIEGWTTAQGRSSTLSSPIRGRDSVGSAAGPPAVAPTATMESSSPPAPRETILDRAFQMRCIPGSETETPGEEKLTSLARFEALMQDMDKKRGQRDSGASKLTAQTPTDLGLRSAWDSDDDSESDDDANEEDDEMDLNHRLAASGYGQRHHGSLHSPRHGCRSHSYSQSQSGVAHEADIAEEDVSMPAGAQRALEFIATGRSSPALSAMRSAASPRSPRSPTGEFPPYSPNNLLPPMNNSGSSQLRSDQCPRQESSSAQQKTTYRQLQVAGTAQPASSHGGDAVPPPPRLHTAPPAAYSQPTTEQQGAVSSVASRRPGPVVEKRLSGSSLKRISITELTKRLSASSLRMVQSNSSSDGSFLKQQQQQIQSASLRGKGRGAMVPPPGPVDRDRCGWRGNVGIDGGFL